jgi:hypothetical protein
LLAVVETRCHAMDTEEGICYKGWGGPDAGLDAVVRLDMAIDCGVLVSCGEWWGVSCFTFSHSESNVAPVNCVHRWWWECHVDGV